MARTIQEIQQSIITSVNTDDNLAALNSTSKTAIWRLWTYIVAYCVWTLEKLFDIFKSEVNETIAAQKPGTLRWYTEKAKAFQLGFDLLPDSDLYNNEEASDSDIEASKVVKYAACVQGNRQNGRPYLRIKIAGEQDEELAPVSSDVEAKVNEYFSRISYAGVDFEITNRPPDNISQTWTIYVNPLLYDSDGQRPDGTRPIEEAIKGYLEQLPFNGTYVPTYHIDAVQKVEGVVLPLLNSCTVQYGEYPPESITDMYIPDAGYLRFDDPDIDLTITYVPRSPIQ